MVDRDDKAHKMADKGREWSTSSGSSVKAVLKENKRDKVTLLRKSDNFTMVFKKERIITRRSEILTALEMGCRKDTTRSIDKFSSQDQRLIRSATGTVKG